MKKLVFVLLAIAALAAGLWATWQMFRPGGALGDEAVLRRVSKDLGVSAQRGTVLSHEDTHGGMGGDGHTFTVVSFSDDHCLHSLQGNWNPLPLTENLSVLIYGSKTRGPALTDEEGKCRIPVIEEGYYIFRDRHPEAEDPTSDFEIFRRPSFNYTIGLYDTGTKTLYYFKEDT